MCNNIQYVLAHYIGKNMFLYAILSMCTCDTIWHIATLLNNFSPQQITQKFDHNCNKYASSLLDNVAFFTSEHLEINRLLICMLLLFVIPHHYIKRDLQGFKNGYARAILYLVSQKPMALIQNLKGVPL